ncbi:MAG: hypothetical protein FK733_04230 [Asgard group archaeon]|nr:hypothetical protein [Asgard group archaeon]
MKKKISILILILTISFLAPILNNSMQQTKAYLSYYSGGTHTDMIFAAVHMYIWEATDDDFFACKEEIFNISHDYYDRMRYAQEDYDSDYYKQWGHYWNPYLHIGLYGNPGAPYHAKNYFEKAINYYLGLGIYPVDKSEAYYNLGHAIHLLQDVTVPHHANLDPFGKHSDYEYFCDVRYKDGEIDFPIYGTYEGQKDWNGNISVEGWIHQAALLAYPYYNIIESSPYNYHLWIDTATFLMGKAVELTAGFIFYFWQIVHNLDKDFDSLGARTEYTHNSDPFLYDTDFDTIGDYEEVMPGLDGYITHPSSNDTDKDYLSDAAEINTYFTHPNINDTDTDTFLDGIEVANGTDPLDPSDHPPFPSESNTSTPFAGYKKLVPIVGFFSIILAVFVIRRKITSLNGLFK